MNADLARLLRIIADGREEYANGASHAVPAWMRDNLRGEADAFRAAAAIIEGDVSRLWALLPTWRLTPDVQQLADRVVGKTEPGVTDAMVDAAMDTIDDHEINIGPTYMRAAIAAALRAQRGTL